MQANLSSYMGIAAVWVAVATEPVASNLRVAFGQELPDLRL